MLSGTTASGFAFSLQDDALDDMELLDGLTDLEKGNPAAISTVCMHLLGEEQRKALYEHLREENGRVRISAVSDELGEILKICKTGKKS